MILAKKDFEEFASDYRSLSTEQFCDKWKCTKGLMMYWAKKLDIWDPQARNQITKRVKQIERENNGI